MGRMLYNKFRGMYNKLRGPSAGGIKQSVLLSLSAGTAGPKSARHSQCAGSAADLCGKQSGEHSLGVRRGLRCRLGCGAQRTAAQPRRNRRRAQGLRGALARQALAELLVERASELELVEEHLQSGAGGGAAGRARALSAWRELQAQPAARAGRRLARTGGLPFSGPSSASSHSVRAPSSPTAGSACSHTTASTARSRGGSSQQAGASSTQAHGRSIALRFANGGPV